MAVKPAIPKGTRDFLPAQAAKRQYIFDTLKKHFESYGYKPIETPAMELLQTLTGKYGEEGDKLIFKILNSGDFLSKIPPETLSTISSNELSFRICEKALRYDLTVPFARFVVQHRNDIMLPFKRYQIQPVWRADRPQKGRYREFYQCDIDSIGSNSLLNEAELIAIMNNVFQDLQIPVTIRINNRKILSGICETAGVSEHFKSITIAIDKLDKIGIEKVKEEIISLGIDTHATDFILQFFEENADNKAKIQLVKEKLKGETAEKGIAELTEIMEFCETQQIDNVKIDFTLARGLDYYTGAIFEVTTPLFNSSICGGGRYDDLTGIFGWEGISGVGVSFGADRIYDVMEENNLFPENAEKNTLVLWINFGKEEVSYIFPIAQKLRNEGIITEVYPDNVKLKKQLKYADTNRIQWVAMCGSEEMKNETVTFKNLKTGTQHTVKISESVEFIKSQK